MQLYMGLKYIGPAEVYIRYLAAYSAAVVICDNNESYCSNFAKHKMLQKGTEETITSIEQVGMY